ncbi:MAG: alanine--tRNA ligase [Minisyncoccales bacterium]|jgi:alanyl-tRNA synthetase
MNSQEIREKFINYYKERSHAVIPSASLIPEDDPTLLFVNSGMFPLVPYFLGEDHPKGKRLVNCQKSFRTDDIEEIGDNRHTTFFEMLGNWSFGDYFKEEQLSWWFDFMINELKLDPERIYQTVYAGDESVEKDIESVEIIKKVFNQYGIAAQEGAETKGDGDLGPGVELDFTKERIFAYKDKNWWQRGDAVGELGGPDSETFYDTGKEHDPKFGRFCHPNCDCGRFLEIGNSVFMQYRKTENGWIELKNKNVDFGGGLERLAMVKNGYSTVFETDLFRPIVSTIEEISGLKYQDNIKAFEIIADHIKATVFIIGDERGVVPSNKQQGYFVRRMIRRAIRYGKGIGISSDDWMNRLAQEVISIYGGIYPELNKNSENIFKEIEKEEQRFDKTLNKGLQEFKKIKKEMISGKEAFNLYQTYGFPIEMIKEIAEESSQIVDEKGFNEELNNHKKLSQTASAGVFKGGLADSSEKTKRLHTATHLLLAALRKTLGDHVVQRGSNITSERLRFDFSHPNKLTEDEINRVEEMVNSIIKDDIEINKKEMNLDKAISSGALATFGEKYPDRVNVYQIGSYSNEVCHGPHVSRTSEIGGFKIIKEESSGAGIRRIKAIIQ